MRAVWSGSLSFGLINIPIKLYGASKERALKFKLLEKHGHCPISYLRVCRNNHKEVPYEDIVKGYEYKKGDYVVLTDEDFKKVSPRSTDTIDILNFADSKDIDPQYYEKPFYIEPDKKSEKAYVLLRAALKRAGKIGIARFVMKGKEHIAAIMCDGNALILQRLRFKDEIRPPKGLNIPTREKYTEKELDVALSLIKHLQKHFRVSEYEDTYAEELEDLIRQRSKGKKTRSRQPAVATDTKMKDLMKLLQKSLEKEKVRVR